MVYSRSADCCGGVQVGGRQTKVRQAKEYRSTRLEGYAAHSAAAKEARLGMIYNDDSLTIMVFHGRPTRPTRAVPSAAMMKQGEAVAFYLLRPVLLRRGNVMLTRTPGRVIPCLFLLLQYVYSYPLGSRVLLSSCVSEYHCCSSSQLRERNGVSTGLSILPALSLLLPTVRGSSNDIIQPTTDKQNNTYQSHIILMQTRPTPQDNIQLIPPSRMHTKSEKSPSN